MDTVGLVASARPEKAVVEYVRRWVTESVLECVLRTGIHWRCAWMIYCETWSNLVLRRGKCKLYHRQCWMFRFFRFEVTRRARPTSTWPLGGGTTAKKLTLLKMRLWSLLLVWHLPSFPQIWLPHACKGVPCINEACEKAWFSRCLRYVSIIPTWISGIHVPSKTSGMGLRT